MEWANLLFPKIIASPINRTIKQSAHIQLKPRVEQTVERRWTDLKRSVFASVRYTHTLARTCTKFLDIIPFACLARARSCVGCLVLICFSPMLCNSITATLDACVRQSYHARNFSENRATTSARQQNYDGKHESERRRRRRRDKTRDKTQS